MLQPETVEAKLKSLTPLVKRHIAVNILDASPDGRKEYDCGEALLFWLADTLMLRNAVSESQLIPLLEEIAVDVIKFGRMLEPVWQQEKPRSMKGCLKLPSCRVAVLDGHKACIDGRDTYIDLVSGEVRSLHGVWPVETLTYNLTAIFFTYSLSV